MIWCASDWGSQTGDLGVLTGEGIKNRPASRGAMPRVMFSAFVGQQEPTWAISSKASVPGCIYPNCPQLRSTSTGQRNTRQPDWEKMHPLFPRKPAAVP